MPEKETPRRVVYQYIPPPGKEHNMAKSVITFQRPQMIVDGTTVPEEALMIRPTPALQYVLPEEAEHWHEQKAVLDKFAVKYGWQELDPSKGDKEGQVPERMLPRPPEDPEKIALRKRVAELEAKIAGNEGPEAEEPGEAEKGDEPESAEGESEEDEGKSAPKGKGRRKTK